MFGELSVEEEWRYLVYLPERAWAQTIDLVSLRFYLQQVCGRRFPVRMHFLSTLVGCGAPAARAQREAVEAFVVAQVAGHRFDGGEAPGVLGVATVAV